MTPLQWLHYLSVLTILAGASMLFSHWADTVLAGWPFGGVLSWLLSCTVMGLVLRFALPAPVALGAEPGHMGLTILLLMAGTVLWLTYGPPLAAFTHPR